MSLVLSVGYVLDTTGSYMPDGKDNDTNMTQHIVKKNQQQQNVMELTEENVTILDRGFRDSIE